MRLTASVDSATEAWQTYVPPAICDELCYRPDLDLGPDRLVTDSYVYPVSPHSLRFTFEPHGTGSITLTLSDIP